MFRPIAFVATLLCISSFLVGCGGGGGGSTTPPTNQATPSPAPTTGASQSVTIGSGPTTITLAANGLHASATIPAVSSGAGSVLTATLSTSPPTGVAAPQSRRPQGTSHAALAYVSFTTSSTVTFSGTLTASLTLPQGTPSQSYYLAMYVPGQGWQYDIAGPITPSNGTVTFTVQIPASSPVTLSAGATYVLAVTTDSVVASISSIVVTLSSPNPSAGTATTVNVSISAKDAAGNPITGNVSYSNPIMLTNSDTSGKFSLSTTTVTSPATQVSARYDGTSLTQATIGATASGVTASNVTPAIFAPTPTVVAEYPIPTQSSDPGGLIVGPDKNLWFIESGSTPKLARATTNGQISEFPVVAASTTGFEALTTGPDNNIWVSDRVDQIQVVSTSGAVVNQFAVHDPADSGGSATMLGGIVTGPDGNMWFGEYQHGVDELTAAGVVTRFAVPSPTDDSGISQMIVGPDGNLWAAAQLDSAIVKITPAGTVAKYLTPTTQTSLISLVNGKDGNIWFTEPYANKIARITTSGGITEYALPGQSGQIGSNPGYIVCDPDGNLWFTSRDNNGVIVRFSPGGNATEYHTMTSGEDPTSIVLGQDGNIWFTTFAGTLGKLVY